MRIRNIAPLLVLVALVFLAAGCGNAMKVEATAKLEAAKTAMANTKAFADAQGTSYNCPDQLASAEDALATAESQYAAEDWENCVASCDDTIDKSQSAADPGACVKVVAAPTPPPASKPVLKKFVMDAVYFDYNRYNIRPNQIGAAKDNAKHIKDKWADKKVRLEGNCDDRGSDEYNMALGDRRAKSVRNFLITMGVKGGNVFTKSLGESNPISKKQNEAAWAKNRRVEFKKLK
jgi:outer membrane protein OmpA-like peptidoglycan-associated protein